MNMMQDILGHDRVKQFFQNAVEKDRLYSTYLFSGPEGIGKKKTALAIAAMLNCQQPEQAPCGNCRSCINVVAHNHVDIRVIEAEKDEIKAEQVEPILEQVVFPPFEGKARVVIIDNAHQFNSTSGNMLLKTLEEPPSGNYFFLVTSKPDLLLPTIRSRCQEVTFSGTELVDQVQIDGADPSALKPWFRIGGGMIHDRASLAVFATERTLALRFLEALLDTTPGFRLEDELTEQMPEMDRQKTLQFIFHIQVLIRDLLALYAGRQKAVINTDLTTGLEQLQNRLLPTHLFQINDLVNRAKNRVFYNISIQQLLSVMLSEARKVVS